MTDTLSLEVGEGDVPSYESVIVAERYRQKEMVSAIEFYTDIESRRSLKR